MNLLPTMINRNLKEVSFLQNQPVKDFDDFAVSNNWKYNKVNDAVGMVTPRVLAMIINEATLTLQEKTASKEDIDKGMMLGTNFPAGPLAWCDQIGIQHVINILQSLHTSTGDERYKVCNLLLEKNKDKEKFY
jgi:3-hydroxybutyryl-CoA dehydrogenase